MASNYIKTTLHPLCVVVKTAESKTFPLSVDTSAAEWSRLTPLTVTAAVIRTTFPPLHSAARSQHKRRRRKREKKRANLWRPRSVCCYPSPVPLQRIRSFFFSVFILNQDRKRESIPPTADGSFCQTQIKPVLLTAGCVGRDVMTSATERWFGTEAQRGHNK